MVVKASKPTKWATAEEVAARFTGLAPILSCAGAAAFGFTPGFMLTLATAGFRKELLKYALKTFYAACKLQ
jgi:hypothetical protein